VFNYFRAPGKGPFVFRLSSARVSIERGEVPPGVCRADNSSAPRARERAASSRPHAREKMGAEDNIPTLVVQGSEDDSAVASPSQSPGTSHLASATVRKSEASTFAQKKEGAVRPTLKS